MRVAVLQTLGLGDFFTALPAIRALRRHFVDDQLIWLGKREYLSLVEPIFDDAIDVRSLATAPHLAFDVGVNFHGSGPHSHQVLDACGRQIAFFDRSLAPDGPTWSPSLHIRYLWTSLLEHYEIAANPGQMYLEHSTSNEGPVIIHVGARDRDRWWPAERFEEVAATFPDAVVIGDANNPKRAFEVATSAQFPTLDELRELVAGAKLIIGVDSGVAHLAYALKKPSVTLFGPAPATRWGPPPNSQHAVLGNLTSIEAIHPEGPCSPHLLSLWPIDVMEAARKVLSLV